jgi:hypothetical protein
MVMFKASLRENCFKVMNDNKGNIVMYQLITDDNLVVSIPYANVLYFSRTLK